ncbi:efflux RND transporter periplasmic adaptor subunit [Persicobacter psychrovividus]|uniref:RND transporter n=1 Tax=Persicobacter psychrovividus TaxID=387638 RepID=A0ABN6L6T0_9BACT|nr:RND transporter [Persicobacter psychrovividus]
MKYYIFLMIGGLVAISACNDHSLENKKEELSELRAELAETKAKIKVVEQQILDLDPDAFNASGSVLNVATIPVRSQSFEHMIDVRGEVQSRKNVMLSAEMMGRVEKINVVEGSVVKKGQSLLHLDADQVVNGIAEVKTSLEFAEKMYKKRAALWEKKVGSEVQYLEAKNQYESLQRKLATLNSQLDQARVKAPFNGQVDEVIAKDGEVVSPGMPLLRLAGSTDMYIRAEVSERYIGKFKRGDQVTVRFPSLNKTVNSTIASLGQVINKSNRTFTIEIRLDGETEGMVKPNLLAVVEVRDYQADGAIVVPTKLIQKDSEGYYVYTVKTDGKAQKAHRSRVELGKSFRGETEITRGLTDGDEVITEGYREAAQDMTLQVLKPTAEVDQK